MTKPLIAYLALKLCQMGILELDNPLPSLEKDLPPLTLRQVLSHTAGFPTANRKGNALCILFLNQEAPLLIQEKGIPT